MAVYRDLKGENLTPNEVDGNFREALQTESTLGTILYFDKSSSGRSYGTWNAPITGDVTINNTVQVEGGVVFGVWSGTTFNILGVSSSLIENVTNQPTVSGTYKFGIIWSGGRYEVYFPGISGTSTPSINAPTSLTLGAATGTTIPLTWTKSTSGVMIEYRAYVGGVLQQTFSGDVALGTLTGLSTGTSYSNITVRAFNGTTESADSNSVSTSTTGASVAAPTSLAAGTVTNAEIPLTWTKSTSAAGGVYRVYDSGVLLQSFGDVAFGTLTGLTASTEYNLTLRYFVGGNESPDSNLIVRTTTASGGGFGAFNQVTTQALDTEVTLVSATPDYWTSSAINRHGIISGTYAGDFKLRVLIGTGNAGNDVFAKAFKIGVHTSTAVNPSATSATWNAALYVNEGLDVKIGNGTSVIDTPTNVTQNDTDYIELRRISGILTAWHGAEGSESQIHSFGTVTGSVLMFGFSGTSRRIYEVEVAV